MKTKLFSIFLLLCFLSVSGEAQTGYKQLAGMVVRVHDGDTLTVQDASGNQYQIRLAGIDAPELRQEFGKKALYNLSGFVFGKNVTIFYKKIDKYGRIVGKVMLNGVDVNLKQVADGCAWHYKEYENEQSETDRDLYSNAEKTSRNNEIGLWSDTALAPWEWRKAKSDSGSESPTPPSARLQETLNPGTSTVTGSPVPNSGDANKTVRVKGYTRKDGTYVAPHTRSAPGKKNN